MYVRIGPYVPWIGPYQIARKIMFWKDRDSETVHEFGRWLSERKDGSDSLLTKLCRKIHNVRKRNIKIHIDEYDVWSMDHTLSLIVYPMLLKLKEIKHGSPCVDDEDVPEHLRSTAAPSVDPDSGMVDSLLHDRWNWVLDEMIWAHGQLANPDNIDSDFDPVPEGVPIRQPGTVVKEDGTRVWDMGNAHGIYNRDRAQARQQRINHGLMLFGKYYQALWD